MKNRNYFLVEHIDHFAKAQEPENIIIQISKNEYKEMAETLFSFGMNLMHNLQEGLHRYTSSTDFLLVELVRVNFTKAELIKWALKPIGKETKYKLNVGLAIHLWQIFQEMDSNIYSQSLLNKIDAQLIQYGFTQQVLQNT